jgi:hypothetical protein
MTDRLEKQLDRLDNRLDKQREESAYIRGRLDEIAQSTAHIPIVVDQQRTLRNSLRHAWLVILATAMSAGVALAKSFL